MHIKKQPYAARFPLNKEINTTKTDSGVKAAVKNASDYNDVDICTSSAVKSSHITFIYIVNYAIDSLKSSSFILLNMKNRVSVDFS